MPRKGQIVKNPNTGDVFEFLETSEEMMTPANFRRVIRNYAAQGVFEKISGLIFGRPYQYKFANEYNEILLEVIRDEQDNSQHESARRQLVGQVEGVDVSGTCFHRARHAQGTPCAWLCAFCGPAADRAFDRHCAGRSSGNRQDEEPRSAQSAAVRPASGGPNKERGGGCYRCSYQSRRRREAVR